MIFNKESDFEEALIKILCKYGWENKVLKHPTEDDLIQNWADILYENNRDIDRLNDYPLTRTEMDQIIDQIKTLRTPLKLNGFINGKTVSIKRDNQDDKMHFGKEISLKIYDRNEIAAGSSRYQIAQQPIYKAKNSLANDRRGDLTLLINGMPVIHIELKKSGVSVKQAQIQIEKYAHEGIFTGIYSLVQIFVAMNPDETTYYANPGPDGKFNPCYYFHWADFNNERIDQWDKVGASLLSIPMAHEMIGFYTVADDSDGVLKVMRSYQYYAASKISDKVAKNKWQDKNQLGGYIWHTTGSGKTLTSFKSAQLIASSKDADKVIFLMDRIELGTQSLKEYRAFADNADDIQDTEDTHVLVSKIKSEDPANTLIVTSIQKMSNIGKENDGLKQSDLDKMTSKRIVFIIDECHRSTFGDMLITIKDTFPNALFFGFTGTPIQDENQKKMNTTSDIFGEELHRYSIADGIRDGNVLGFDPYKVMTYKDNELREAVALVKAKANNRNEALSDPEKKKIYLKYMDKSKISMITKIDDFGNKILGIEDYIPNAQYQTDEHTNAVVEDIINGWDIISQNSKFHAIFATSSIPEAINYYKLLCQKHNKKLFGVVSNMNIAIERKDLLKQFDCLICNQLESSILFSRDFKEISAEELSHTLIDEVQQSEFNSLIVTLGEAGSLYVKNNGESGFCQARQIEVKDTTGAGDAFCAGTSAGLTYGKSMLEAMKIGSHLASSVIASCENVCPCFSQDKFDIVKK